MTRDEINNKIQEIRNQLHSFVGSYKGKNAFVTKEYRNYKKQIKELYKQLKELDYQEEIKQGKIYTNDVWASNVTYSSDKSLIDARRGLINKLKKMPGVVVDYTEEELNKSTGVISVSVYTRYKVYQYTVHAHYTLKKIGEKEVKNFFDEGTHMEPITQPDYTAWLSPLKYNDGFGTNWAWRSK